MADLDDFVTIVCSYEFTLFFPINVPLTSLLSNIFSHSSLLRLYLLIASPTNAVSSDKRPIISTWVGRVKVNHHPYAQFPGASIHVSAKNQPYFWFPNSVSEKSEELELHGHHAL